MTVAKAVGAVVVRCAFIVGAARVVGDLEKVLTVLPVESDLIVGGLVADKRSEGTPGIGGVVEDFRNWGGETVV